MKLGYICTNYNNSHYTVQAVETFLGACGKDARIVIVDNASRQDQADPLKALAKAFDQVILDLSHENLGYFPGLNRGIALMRKRFPDIEWMFVGNNDLEFPKALGETLNRKAGHLAKYCVIAPNIVTVDGVRQNPHALAPTRQVRQLIHEAYYSNFQLARAIKFLASKTSKLTRRRDSENWKHGREIFMGHGSCYLLTPKFFGFFEALAAPSFLYYEEFFLSHQLSEIGEKIYYEPDIEIVHHWHATLANVPSRVAWQYSRDAHKQYRKLVPLFSLNKADRKS